MSNELTPRIDKTLATSKSPLAQAYRKLRYERPDFLEQVTNYCLLGANNFKLAALFGVEQGTILYWLKHSEEFTDAVHAGREQADAEVAQALHRRATGYTVTKPKLVIEKGNAVVMELTEHIPADTPAARFWLTNRQPEHWREKQSTELSGANGGPIDTEIAIKFVGVTSPTPLRLTDTALPANDVIENDQTPDGI